MKQFMLIKINEEDINSDREATHDRFTCIVNLSTERIISN